MQLTAHFDMSPDHLREIVAIEEKRAGLPFGVTIEPSRTSLGGIVLARGPAQGVMFVIGAVANHGEDTLRRVVAFP